MNREPCEERPQQDRASTGKVPNVSTSDNHSAWWRATLNASPLLQRGNRPRRHKERDRNGGRVEAVDLR